MNYILFDPPEIEKFYPFTLTRPLAEMRVFGGTIKELWEQFLGCKVSYLTSPYLSELYMTKWTDQNILIPSTHLPKLDHGISSISQLENHSLKIIKDSCDLKTAQYTFSKYHMSEDSQHNRIISIKNKNGEYAYLYDCLGNMHEQLDGDTLPTSLISKLMSTVNQLDVIPCNLKQLKNKFPNVFFNDDYGPIIIDEDVLIMEGAVIKGPVHICSGSTIKMGAKIYGPTIIGPKCKIGGEVSNCLFLGYSNKAHDGFLGHSIIGEWCNIGAGTSNSNLKNDYGFVKMWDYSKGQFNESANNGVKSQFLGLYMGDHSKCAINTSFNTGTTVGVNCNIFGFGFPRNFIPSFSWGGPQGIKEYDLNKAIFVAKKVMQRRDVELGDKYDNMLSAVHNITSRYR